MTGCPAHIGRGFSVLSSLGAGRTSDTQGQKKPHPKKKQLRNCRAAEKNGGKVMAS
jgi:hypothetical protein